MDLFSDRNDVWTLMPFLEQMKERLGVTADFGYESEEGYRYLEKKGQDAYIKAERGWNENLYLSKKK